MNLDRALRKAKMMQSNDPDVADITNLLVKSSKEKKLEKAYNQIEKRSNFFESSQKAIQMINQFLNFIDLDINHTIFSGGILHLIDDEGFYTEAYLKRDIGYINKPTISRLIPKRYLNENFNNKNNWANFTIASARYNGDTDSGIAYFKSIYGTKLQTQEKCLSYSFLILIHEYYHQICIGAQFLSNHVFTEEDNPKNCKKLNFSLMEGTVELLKQITASFYGQSQCNFEKTYPNEVALVYHLVKAVAEKLGKPGYPNWKKTLKLMVEWAATGGTEKPFVKMCKNIKTQSLPDGFDIYSVNSFQMKRLDNFMKNNANKNTDISVMINSLKREAV